jgi:hypothetical protein
MAAFWLLRDSIEIDSWEDLKSLAKKLDIIALRKSTIRNKVHELIGIKLRGSTETSRLPITFKIEKASKTGEKDLIKEFWGDSVDVEAEDFQEKMKQFYQAQGIKVFYTK